MSIQEALRIAGIISCFMAAALAVLTIHSFVSQDIPGVLDDLSGRRRMRELGPVTTSAPCVPVTPNPQKQEQPVRVWARDVATQMGEVAEPTTKTVADPFFFEIVESVVLCDDALDSCELGEGL